MDHSNQLHHACLMWTKAEHLDVNFDIAYDKIKYDDIVIKLRQQVEIMDIPLDYKNNLRNGATNTNLIQNIYGSQLRECLR